MVVVNCITFGVDQVADTSLVVATCQVASLVTANSQAAFVTTKC